MKMKRQNGFSLVELMVAMVVSLVVILGAGQLFISLSQTSERITRLSEKQAAVNFAVETLLRDIRRADWRGNEWDGEVIKLHLKNRGDFSSGCLQGDDIVKVYRLRDISDGGNSLGALESRVEECAGSATNDAFQELVRGFLGPDGPGFYVLDKDIKDGVVPIVFQLLPTGNKPDPDVLVFHAMNRTRAVGGGTSGPPGPGPDPGPGPGPGPGPDPGPDPDPDPGPDPDPDPGPGPGPDPDPDPEEGRNCRLIRISIFDIIRICI